MATTPKALAAALLVLASTPTPAEAPKPPAPGPETLKLGYFVGTWKTEGTTAENPFMPAGKMTSTDVCEWFEGKFAVVCTSQGKGPMGPTKGLGVMNWSPNEKVYLYYGVDNSPMAMSSVPRGTLEGDVWTYLDESKVNGKTVRSRYVIARVDAKSYTFKWEVEGEGGAWKAVLEGKSTKVK